MITVSPFKEKSFLPRMLLYPFSLIYCFVVWFRHFLYDTNILKSVRYNFPVVVIGNLALGGTGKTPFTAYICGLLIDKYNVATVSRGYKRKTAGFYEVQTNSVHSDVGDEPHWIKTKFPKATVCVGEDRVLTLSYLIQEKPYIDMVILDDALQHRRLNSDMNILLTDYSNLFIDDRMLPLGTLRDTPQSMCRAKIVIVTKCPPTLSSEKQRKIAKSLALKPYQRIFFSIINYEKPYSIIPNQYAFKSLAQQNVLLITGIANPKPLLEKLETQKSKVKHLAFADHFDFSYEDILNIIGAFDKLPKPKIILLTEKDAVKLKRFERYWKHLPVFVVPISVQLMDKEDDFLEILSQYITSF